MGGGPPGFPQNSTWSVVLGQGEPRDRRLCAYGALTLCGEAFQTSSTKTWFGDSLAASWFGPSPARYPQSATPRSLTHPAFGLFPFRSPLLGESRLFSLPQGTEMFQFPRFASLVRGILEVHSSGLPHSGISGSTLAYSYPELIAVSHALHRLLAPRHPPYALCYLTANL